MRRGSGSPPQQRRDAAPSSTEAGGGRLPERAVRSRARAAPAGSPGQRARRGAAPPLARLLAQLADAALHPERWGRFLSSLALALRCSDLLLRAHYHPQPGRSLLLQRPLGQTAEALAARMRAAAHAGAGGGCAAQPRLHPVARCPESELLARRLRGGSGAGRARQALHLRVAEGPGVQADLYLLAEDRRSRLDAQRRRLLRGLVPHLERAFTAQAACAEALFERAVLRAVLDRLRLGVVLLDASCRLRAHNARAHRHLLGGHRLRLCRGRLCASTVRETAAIHREVAAVARAGRDSVLVLEEKRPAGQRPSLALLLSVEGVSGRGAGTPPPLVTLYVTESDADPEPLSRWLHRVWDLTPGEARLAARLAAGDTLGEAAARLGVQRTTVRNQLRQIFAKTGTRRQPELVRTLLTGTAQLELG
ncbi:MAG: hypothetical protein KatS3mg102_2693 [Planctomycetota bacterium]|nr:MAG: hypothetical protein KatS3mg102_2693 [Planctomycetota bacterium]